jgi:hypothetical protein
MGSAIIKNGTCSTNTMVLYLVTGTPRRGSCTAQREAESPSSVTQVGVLSGPGFMTALFLSYIWYSVTGSDWATQGSIRSPRLTLPLEQVIT